MGEYGACGNVRSLSDYNRSNNHRPHPDEGLFLDDRWLFGYPSSRINKPVNELTEYDRTVSDSYVVTYKAAYPGLCAHIDTIVHLGAKEELSVRPYCHVVTDNRAVAYICLCADNATILDNGMRAYSRTFMNFNPTTALPMVIPGVVTGTLLPEAALIARAAENRKVAHIGRLVDSGGSENHSRGFDHLKRLTG